MVAYFRVMVRMMTLRRKDRMQAYRRWYQDLSWNSRQPQTTLFSTAARPKRPGYSHREELQRWEWHWANWHACTSWTLLWAYRWCGVSSDREICFDLARTSSPWPMAVMRETEAARPYGRQSVDVRAFRPQEEKKTNGARWGRRNGEGRREGERWR